jgi:hypothetical protein
MGRRVAWHAQATPMHCRPHDDQMKKFSFRGRWLLTQVCSPLLGEQVRRLKCVVGPSHHFRPLHHQTPHHPPRWYAAVGHSTRASFDASECPRRYPLPLSSRGNPWHSAQTSGGRGIGSRGHAVRGWGWCRNAELWPKKCSTSMRGLDKHAHTGHRCARYKSWSPRELLTSRCFFKWPTPTYRQLPRQGGACCKHGCGFQGEGVEIVVEAGIGRAGSKQF